MVTDKKKHSERKNTQEYTVQKTKSLTS